MKDIMLADSPVEEREEILRNSCDQILERSYTRKFDQAAINERRAELSDVFKKFNINGNTGWNPNKLGQFLRLNRSVFADKEQCMVLVTKLKNFTAKAKAEIQKQRDQSGSMAEVYRTEVESNLPKSFTIVVPIFKGTAKTAIEVEFDHYIVDGEVALQLVSPGANECVEQFRDNCLDEVINKIREIAPEIPILEV